MRFDKKDQSTWGFPPFGCRANKGGKTMECDGLSQALFRFLSSQERKRFHSSAAFLFQRLRKKQDAAGLVVVHTVLRTVESVPSESGRACIRMSLAVAGR